MKFSEAIRKVLWGTPFGEVYPAREPPPQPVVDGRTVALRIFREYLTEIIYRRPDKPKLDGSANPPIEFRITPENIHIEWPDREVNLSFPAIALLAGSTPANYDQIGLTGYVEEDTRDKFGKGTVVQWMSEYQENVVLEVWANTKPERRAILAGLEWALSPTEQMYGIRFTMPDYFNELVCFTFKDRAIVDDEDAVRGRRRARITIEMRFTVVALVNYSEGRLQMKVDTDVDQDTNEPVELEDLVPYKRPGDDERKREGCC